ncbi:hypothetical protein LCGC14_2615600 [marine sediment metagenome]|uniref:Uncharacterized protein n=1 Tax=marine sediment metagenome TaxID=412755 RepID=A0A0F9CX95_9ZZZZ
MAKYATDEQTWECWGCGFDIPIRSMLTADESTQTGPRHQGAGCVNHYRCPNCEENILFIEEQTIRRAGVYYGSLPHVDLTDPLGRYIHRHRNVEWALSWNQYADLT